MHASSHLTPFACILLYVCSETQLVYMEGDGELGEWLKQTGREVARAAGNELKSVAKDKVASYARDLIGMGLKEGVAMVRT